jgi:hypothetical protein
MFAVLKEEVMGGGEGGGGGGGGGGGAPLIHSELGRMMPTCWTEANSRLVWRFLMCEASGNAKICVRPHFLAALLQLTPQPLPDTWSLRPISSCDFAASAPPIDSASCAAAPRDVRHLDRARRAG